MERIKTIELQPTGEELAANFTFPETKEHVKFLSSLQDTQVKHIHVYDFGPGGVSFDFNRGYFKYGIERSPVSCCVLTRKIKFIEIQVNPFKTLFSESR